MVNLNNDRGCSADGETDWRLGVAIAAAWALGGPASTAAPLQLVTDQLLPFENLSDAEAPGFSTEVLRQVFAAMGQEASA